MLRVARAARGDASRHRLHEPARRARAAAGVRRARRPLHRTICEDWLPSWSACGSTPWTPTARTSRSPPAQCDRLFTAAKASGPERSPARGATSNVGGSQVAARHGALSCDHLEYATDADASALAARRHGRGDVAGRVLRARRETTAADRGPAPARRAARGRFGLQSGLGPRRIAAARDEHGATAVRTHERGSAARRHAARGTRARRARAARLAGAGPRGRLRQPGRSTRSTNSATGPASIRAAWSRRTAASSSSATSEAPSMTQSKRHERLERPGRRGRRRARPSLAPGRAACWRRRIVPASRCSASPATRA